MDFNIEAYLDSLQEDIEKIDIQNRNLTYIPSLERFQKLKILYCSFNKLTSLPQLNKNLERLYCCNNQLIYLPQFNENLYLLYCYDNKLTFLPELNEKLQTLHCGNNQLTFLPSLNKNLQELYCGYNQLISLPPLNKKLQTLHCGNNQLTYLPPLNENLHLLYCYDNNLTSLPSLNKNLQKLHCDGNPINEIIKGNVLRDKKKQIQTINNLRYLYYSLKFKKQFLHLLWMKIREPKIRKKYHPGNLMENIEKDTDFILKIVYDPNPDV